MTNPGKLTPRPLVDWDPSLAGISAEMLGRPLNVHALMAHHPQLLQAWWSFRNHVVSGGELGKRCGELVILRVALHMKSWYEWASHVERALACGLSAEELERVKQGAHAPEWAPAEALLLQAVDELVSDHAITGKTLQALSLHYSTRQVMDLIAIQGMYVILGGMINTWPLELDAQIEEKLPAAVNKTQFTAEFPR